MNLPKVLIIGQPFNNDTGGGITLTNLFKGWDRDKLAVACSGYYLLNNIDTDICNTYYQLGHKENKWCFPFNYLQRKYSSGLLRFDEKKNQNLTIKKSNFRIKIIMKILYPFLEFVGLIHKVNKTILSTDFKNWLVEYKPDVIYDQNASRAGILFCIAVQSFLKKPLIFHMMDDWPSVISIKGPFKNHWQRKIDLEFRRLLDQSTILMSISDEMAKEYKLRYNKDFVTFHNTIDIQFWEKFQKNSYELKENPTILYAGRIGLGIDDSLELIAKSIESINEELNTSIKFILQTNIKPSWINNYKNASHSKFIAYDDLPKTLSESDILLIPYDFSPTAIKFIKYSMPTKAPEYMITGTPIIIFAPEETAIAIYAKKYNWAKVITKNKLNEVSDGIKQLIQLEDLRALYSKNAVKTAVKNHDAKNITNQFRKTICSIISEQN
jgi:glycosyltransferase involved in cell wall biosynthesis